MAEDPTFLTPIPADCVLLEGDFPPCPLKATVLLRGRPLVWEFPSSGSLGIPIFSDSPAAFSFATVGPSSTSAVVASAGAKIRIPGTSFILGLCVQFFPERRLLT